MKPIKIEPLTDYSQFKRLVKIAVAALILLIIGFTLWKSITVYRLTIRGAELQTRGYASALKEHAERALSEADNMLLDVIEYMQAHGGIESKTDEHLRTFLTGHPRTVPQIASIILVNREGLLFAHSLDTPLKQANVADRDYFIHHRDNPAVDTPFISKPFKSRINGKWRITLSRPIRSNNGEFVGLVAVALEMEYFRRFYSSLDLGRNGKIVMVRRDGVLLLAEPFRESDYATDFKKSHLIRTYLPRSPKGTYHIAGGTALLEPNARILSYDSMERFPVAAVSNMDKDEVLAQWRQNTSIQAALVAAVSLALWLLALVLLRQIKRIEEAHQIQMKQQIEIAKSAEEWQSTFDAVEDAIWVMDLDRHLLRANRATERIFDTQRDKVIGHLCCEVVHNGSIALPDCPFQKMLDSGHRATMQLVMGERWYEVSVDPVKNDAGKITGAVHIVSDVTEHTQLEMQLRQSQKMEAIGHLAGGIAHDFNNMLTPILGYAEMVAARLPAGDPLSTKIAGISAAAHKAKDLTHQLLSFGRRNPISTCVFDLNDVIESFYLVLRRTIRESITIHLVLDPAGAFVSADRSQMEQIILNMTVNAQDALSANGEIFIETCTVFMEGENARLHPGMVTGNYTLFSFRDNGCGMCDEVLAHIFEPFFTTKPVGHGTGLGLATVYGIVKQHNGYISVSSRKNEGTTFRIYLPSSLEVPSKDPKGVTFEHDLADKGRTILVVEDNEMVLEMVREMLEGYGYKVLVAASADQAMEIAFEGNRHIDLLVSDVVMPGMGGPELYEQLVVKIPLLKVVYISGYPMNPSIRNGTLEEEVSYLQKPFTAEALVERIRLVM